MPENSDDQGNISSRYHRGPIKRYGNADPPPAKNAKKTNRKGNKKRIKAVFFAPKNHVPEQGNRDDFGKNL